MRDVTESENLTRSWDAWKAASVTSPSALAKSCASLISARRSSCKRSLACLRSEGSVLRFIRSSSLNKSAASFALAMASFSLSSSRKSWICSFRFSTSCLSTSRTFFDSSAMRPKASWATIDKPADKADCAS